ncbi:MAG: endonuclease IV, partial [Ruthenibacterium sp.]
MRYVGSHISSAGGYAAMGRQAVLLGANTFAFFTRNPRGGAIKAMNP